MTHPFDESFQEWQKKKVAELKHHMDADPAYRLMHVREQLEDLESLLHVFYRSACYVSDCENHVADEIFTVGIAEGGDMAMISVISKQVNLIYSQIKSIEADLPRTTFIKHRTKS
jgi:hypothetical protein